MPTFSLERKLIRQGFNLIAGVDEAGRGPLAGPIVAAAVILPLQFKLPGLNDSKKLTARQRNSLFAKINRQALAIGVAIVSHQEIDKLGIDRANVSALTKAVAALKLRPDYVLVDGARLKLACSLPQMGINRGDSRCASISAASIIAKVTRDRLMAELHLQYPRYNFRQHKGYGTPEHLWRLAKYGSCPIHRRSFAPVS